MKTKFGLGLCLTALIILLAACQMIEAEVNAAKHVQAIDDPAFEGMTVSIDGSVMVIEMNAPPMNAVSVPFLTGLNAALDMAEEDDTVGAIVIAGAGEDMFSGGAGEFGLPGPDGMTHTEYAHVAFSRMASYPMPIIAAINGLAGQGGNELAMATDIRIAGENAQFTQVEVQLGLFPGFGGAQRLAELVGHGRAVEIIMTGRPVGAEEALSIGLVSRVVPVGDTLEEAIALGNQLAETLDPKALATYKGRVAARSSESLTETLQGDQVAFDELLNSPDFAEALQKFMQRQQQQQ